MKGATAIPLSLGGTGERRLDAAAVTGGPKLHCSGSVYRSCFRLP
jgi:hypothetical protein